MIENTAPQQYYVRGIAHGDVTTATKNNPARVVRHEFVTRVYNAYLSDEGRYCESFVAEHPYSDYELDH
jgi:hypothetical protein